MFNTVVVLGKPTDVLKIEVKVLISYFQDFMSLLSRCYSSSKSSGLDLYFLTYHRLTLLVVDYMRFVLGNAT